MSVRMICGVSDGRGKLHHGATVARFDRDEQGEVVQVLQTQEEWERFMQVVPINGVRYVVTPCMKHAVLQARFEDIEAALDSVRPVVVGTRSAFHRSL